MSIKKIDKNELRGYEGKEGLILQGCGGNPQEWVDGINDLFTKEGILLDGTKFGDDNCAVFENNGLTCLLYEFNDDTKVDIGKLAMWAPIPDLIDKKECDKIERKRRVWNERTKT